MARTFTVDAISVALEQAGQHTRGAAALLGCSHVTIWKFRKRRGDNLAGHSAPRFAGEEILAAVDRRRGDLAGAAADLGCCVATVKKALPPLPRPQRVRDARLLAAVAKFEKPTAAAHFLGCGEALVRLRMKKISQQHTELAA
jgi:hypothetical protein